jgi:hypothetical protein
MRVLLVPPRDDDPEYGRSPMASNNASRGVNDEAAARRGGGREIGEKGRSRRTGQEGGNRPFSSNILPADRPVVYGGLERGARAVQA